MDPMIRDFAERLMAGEDRTLTTAERRVLRRLAQRLAISTNVNTEFGETLTFGQRLADRVAAFGGSWGFILGFFGLLAMWVGLNAWALPRAQVFDAYPFVFLNLILSMLAAIQAPVIMMSQNRQAAKDRLAATHDYEVNLKAELEIMSLHEKLDDLRTKQLGALFERQEAMIARIARKVGAA